MKMKSDDFWYAVNNTEIIVMPTNYLATFGTTYLHYYMVSELMDTANQIRVREGTIQSRRPEIITPTFYQHELLEGFGEEAKHYIDWLQLHLQDIRILQYGFKLQKKELNEHLVSGKVKEILEQVKQKVKKKNDPLAAVILGVDDPWDVCLLKFMIDIIKKSVPFNFNELGRHKLLEDVRGVPRGIRNDIEESFLKASHDPSQINSLVAKIRKHGLFEEYEDRFFALIRQHKK